MTKINNEQDTEIIYSPDEELIWASQYKPFVKRLAHNIIWGKMRLPNEELPQNLEGVKKYLNFYASKASTDNQRKSFYIRFVSNFKLPDAIKKNPGFEETKKIHGEVIEYCQKMISLGNVTTSNTVEKLIRKDYLPIIDKLFSKMELKDEDGFTIKRYRATVYQATVTAIKEYNKGMLLTKKCSLSDILEAFNAYTGCDIKQLNKDGKNFSTHFGTANGIISNLLRKN